MATKINSDPLTGFVDSLTICFSSILLVLVLLLLLVFLLHCSVVETSVIEEYLFPQRGPNQGCLKKKKIKTYL